MTFIYIHGTNFSNIYFKCLWYPVNMMLRWLLLLHSWSNTDQNETRKIESRKGIKRKLPNNMTAPPPPPQAAWDNSRVDGPGADSELWTGPGAPWTPSHLVRKHGYLLRCDALVCQRVPKDTDETRAQLLPVTQGRLSRICNFQWIHKMKHDMGTTIYHHSRRGVWEECISVRLSVFCLTKKLLLRLTLLFYTRMVAWSSSKMIRIGSRSALMKLFFTIAR